MLNAHASAGLCARLGLAALTVSAVVLVSGPRAGAAPTVFKQLIGPIGVATASDGSIFVTYDGVFDVRLAKFSPTGQLLKEVAFGNFGSTGAVGKLAIDPATGILWDLLTTGEILLFDPETLAGNPIGSLRQTSIDTTGVFDVSQARTRDMSGEIQPSLSTFGDIALFRAENRLDAFVTGRSSNGIPYVARLRWVGDSFSAKVIAAASLSNQFDNVARGVAVNRDGLVLTTLPVPTPSLDAPDRGVVFSETYPEAGVGPALAMQGHDLSSRGIATDGFGNFYVTGIYGSSLCGTHASGSIVIVSPAAEFVTCHPYSSTSANSQDVAVTSDHSRVYTTLLANPGAVLNWGPITPAPPPARAAAAADFDGDGASDISVFRPGNRFWFVHGGTVAQFGTTGDVPVPADYDGDGDTEIAVFRPANGYWFVDGVGISQFGTAGDIPVPADYDGDGDADIAVFRPGNGYWFIQGGPIVQFGTNGDIPVPADYDGDGDADIAVFRPGTGYWFGLGGATLQFGTNGDIPVPADYNGDGTADVAVFRPGNGYWFLNGGETAQFGTNGDVPVPADYDGNGGADIAVFRPTNGYWFVNGGGITQFGASGDVALPLPDAIRRFFFGPL